MHIPQPRAPAGKPRNRKELNPFQQQCKFLEAQIPASSRPRAEIKLDAGSLGALPRALRSLRRPSLGRRPPSRGAGRGRLEAAGQGGPTRKRRGRHALRRRAAPRLLSVGSRAGGAGPPTLRRTAPALASPRRPGVRVLPPACRPGASACQSAAAPRGPGSRSRCRPGRRGRGQPLPLTHLPRPLPAFSALWSPSLGPPPLLQMR